METAQRTPLTNPRAGDVVQAGDGAKGFMMAGKRRKVEEVEFYSDKKTIRFITYRQTRKDGSYSDARYCSHGTWMEWCRANAAEVVAQGVCA